MPVTTIPNGRADRMRISKLRMALRALALISMTLALLPFYLLTLPLGISLAEAIKRLWFKGACGLSGLRVNVIGAPSAQPGTLFVANHVSYLDIPVLGSLAEAAFVAKAEVAYWPVFGFLSRIAGTIFIRRKAADVKAQSALLRRKLNSGKNLLIFPEGTSSDGTHVLPFRSSLFAAVSDGVGEPGLVQPVSIAYTHYRDGAKLVCGLQAFYAWFGEMELLPHLLTVFGLAGATVEVRFAAPVPAEAFKSRKGLAAYCQDVVADNLARSHSARPTPLPLEAEEAILIQV